MPENTVGAVERSVRLLHALRDETSGHLPNLGSNDGALLLRCRRASTVTSVRLCRRPLSSQGRTIRQDRLYDAG